MLRDPHTASGKQCVGLHRVRLSYNFPWFPILRQTPGGEGVWGNYRFVIDANPDARSGHFDAWVVYNNLADGAEREAICAKERTILLVGEPPSRSDIHPSFAAQFGTLVTCHRSVQHPNLYHTQQALPWWVGLQREEQFKFVTNIGYQEFAAMTAIPKTRDISIICSSLAITPEHRKRIRFVRDLKRHFGSRMEFFGEGSSQIADKWDAIAPFKYHVVLENSRVADYWTEKLADAFLGAAMPIYWGCPNIGRYFSPESMAAIDVDRPAEAIETIERILAADPYEVTRKAIWQARQRILDEYNLFPMLVSLIEKLPLAPATRITLRPTSDFPPSLGMRLRRYGHLVQEGIARTWMRVAG